MSACRGGALTPRPTGGRSCPLGSPEDRERRLQPRSQATIFSRIPAGSKPAAT